jgi:hypothetical protein
MNIPEPHVFFAYAPRGVGLRCAVAYLASRRDAYGWFTGPRDGGVESAFFVLEDFYSPRETRYLAVREEDLHGGLLEEARSHELARMQEAFRREWLVYRSDPHAGAELGAYADAELAAGPVAVRFERLAKFSKLHANWTYYSHGFESGVLGFLARHWPLDFGEDDLD